MGIFRPRPHLSIPNSPFYYPETDALSSTSGPLIVGSGIDIDYATGVISATGGGGGSTNVQVTSPIINTGTPANPVIGIQLANTLQSGAVRVGQNINVSSGTISVNNASTLQAGVVRLNNTTTSSSDQEALTAYQGKVLQDQIDIISVTGSLILAGTLNAALSEVASVTTQGSSAGFTVGANLPAPAPAISSYYVLVSTGGTYTPTGSSTAYTAVPGDWFLCNGTTWQYLPFGANPPYATETSPGVIEIATAAEVQAGTDSTRAVTPASLSSTFVPNCTLAAKGSLISATAAGSPQNVALGAESSVLTVCNACPTGLTWAPAGNTAIPCSLLTAKGQLVASSAANTPTALSAGSDGQVLVACALCSSGFTWVSSAASGSIPCSLFTDAQQIIVSSAANTPGVLPIGADGCFLMAVGGAVEWSSNTAVPCACYVEKGTILTADVAGEPIAIPYPSFDCSILLSCALCCGGWTSIPYNAISKQCFSGPGQLIASSGALTYSALAAGACGSILTSNPSCALGLQWSPGFQVYQTNTCQFDALPGGVDKVLFSNLTPGCYQVITSGCWTSGEQTSGCTQLISYDACSNIVDSSPEFCISTITTQIGVDPMYPYSLTWSLQVCGSTNCVAIRLHQNVSGRTAQVCFWANALRIG